jgi:hypothetical protein
MGTGLGCELSRICDWEVMRERVSEMVVSGLEARRAMRDSIARRAGGVVGCEWASWVYWDCMSKVVVGAGVVEGWVDGGVRGGVVRDMVVAVDAYF